jgi:hypothetical protein
MAWDLTKLAGGPSAPAPSPAPTANSSYAPTLRLGATVPGTAAQGGGNPYTVGRQNWGQGTGAVPDAWYPNAGAPQPTDPNSQAFKDYQAYGQGQANANAAASAAGTLAAKNHGVASGQAPLSPGQRDPAAASSGLDFMKPGAAETFNSTYQPTIMAPGETSKWLEANGPAMSGPSMTSDYARTAISKGADLPSANMDPYYDRAQEKAVMAINNQLAARGSYGSGVGLGQVSTAITDLRAQQAKDEADYGLQRSGLANTWTSTLGGLANAADTNENNRWQLGLTGAATAGAENLNRWKAGEQAAGDAQSAQRTRGQDFFNNNFTMGGALSSTAGNAYENAGAQDQAIMDAIISLGIGTSAESVAAAMKRAQSDDDFRNSLIQGAALMNSAKGSSDKKES